MNIRFFNGLKGINGSETGATAVEYGIMVGFVAAVIIAVVTVLGGKTQSAFQAVVNGF